MIDEIMMTDVGDDAVMESSVKTKPKRPSMYHVILINDDFTPMDFVVRVLTDLFSKSEEDALAIMLEVHHFGKGIAGTYTKEIAHEKSDEAMNIAKMNKYPLVTVVEAAPSDGDTGDNS